MNNPILNLTEAVTLITDRLDAMQAEIWATARLARATAIELAVAADDGLAVVDRLRRMALDPLPLDGEGFPRILEARDLLEQALAQIEQAVAGAQGPGR